MGHFVTHIQTKIIWCYVFFSFCVLLQIYTYQLFLFQSSPGSEYCLLKSRIPIYKKMKSYWKTNISWSILVLIQANLSSCHDAMDTLFILTHYVLVPPYIRFICHWNQPEDLKIKCLLTEMLKHKILFVALINKERHFGKDEWSE